MEMKLLLASEASDKHTRECFMYERQNLSYYIKLFDGDVFHINLREFDSPTHVYSFQK